MKDQTLKYSFGLFSTILFVGLLYKLTKTPGGIILPGYFLGCMVLIVVLIVSLFATAIAKLIFKTNSFLTLFTIVTTIAFIALHYWLYSPTLKIIVPKGYSGQVTLVLSNVDKNILTIDKNGIGYITKWTFDKTYTPPIVTDSNGEKLNNLCVGFNPSTFWGKGVATSFKYSGKINFISFSITPKDTLGKDQDYGINFTEFVDTTKLTKE
jgi:hypothetical protein